MLIEREYEYKPTWWIILLGGAMFGFATIFFSQKALSNDRGLIINGIIELSESSATVFYWVLAFFSLCFVLVTIAFIIHRIKFRQRIAFISSEIIVPASRWSSAEKSIEYKSISDLSIFKFNGQKTLNIIHSDGKSTISSGMLKRKTFDEIVDFLSAKVGKQNL